MSQQKSYRKKYISLVTALAGTVPFILISISLITGNPFEEYSNLKLLIGVISLAFWVVLVLWAVINTIKNPDALILDSHGFRSFTDNNSGQQLNWKVISEIGTGTVRNQDIIGFKLEDQVKLKLGKLNSNLEKIVRRNQDQYNFDIIITPKDFNQKTENLMDVIEAFNSKKIIS